MKIESGTNKVQQVVKQVSKFDRMSKIYAAPTPTQEVSRNAASP